ncbi:MAG: aldehyde dehydrogenase, partial [Psychrobacillus psychrodurans]
MKFTEQQLNHMLGEHQSYFYAGITRPVAFRIEQLEILKNTIKKYEEEVIDALYKDLRKSEFESYVTEIGLVYDNISYMVKNIERWM